MKLRSQGLREWSACGGSAALRAACADRSLDRPVKTPRHPPQSAAGSLLRHKRKVRP